MSEQDKYDVLEKIGHGSFGIIRKVRRKTDGFIMCRKEISYLRMSQKEREQLHAEFQILSHLRHPNIVAYYHREHLKQSQDLHLYMEYCGNGDLGRVIKELVHKGVYAQENFVWSVLSQLVSALYRCHYGVDPPEVGSNVLGLFQREVAKGPQGNMTILHRDLKPENVFLGEDNSVKLGDFGLSKMIKSHDFASTYVGTPFYMSPEICAAEKYTLKSDIWSLGCIVYELCAREPPFNAKTHYQLVQKIKEGKVANLPDMYSPELNNVIKECLRVNPDTRPDTAYLMNLPIVRLMRKEKEVVDLNRLLRQREEALIRREKEVTEKMSALEGDRALMRQEMDASVRREWEVKARLEIDRLVQVELETLKARFETEVQARVEKEVAHQKTAMQLASRQSSRSSADFGSSKSSSFHTSSSADDFPSAHDATDMTEISVDSPAPQPKSAANKRISTTTSTTTLAATRTPYTRAHTTIAANLGTPMDIEMASPSPVAIQNLSLSPRRTAAARAPGQPAGNLFATANAFREQNERWESQSRGTASSADSDDEDMMPSPSLTRNLRSAKNPFTSKTKPILSSTKAAAAPISRLKSALSAAVSTKTAAAAAAVAAAQAQAKSSHDSTGARSRNGSPDRKISKIPSVANLYSHSSSGDTTPTPSITSASSSSLPRRGSVDMPRKGTSNHNNYYNNNNNNSNNSNNNNNSSSSNNNSSSISSSGGGNACSDSSLSSAPSLPKVGSATKTAQIRGRTLVELQQARAGGRPLSAVISALPSSFAAAPASAENTSPKRAAAGRGGVMGNDRRASSGPGVLDSGVAVWDPEKDEMPSPFLKRQVMRA